MDKKNSKRKATNKELTQAIIDLNQRVNHIFNMVRGFDSIFTIYLEAKGDKEMLEKKEVSEMKRNNFQNVSIYLSIMNLIIF